MAHRLFPYYSETYHGKKNSRPYFEGWYYKHVSQEFSFALIPGVHYGYDARQDHSFIQILTEDNSFFLRFPVEQFSFSVSPFSVKIGNNSFSMSGINIDIDEQDVKLNAELVYHNITRLSRSCISPTIMGPFAYMPFMQCNHDVLSLGHDVEGKAVFNSKEYNCFGTGYIEKD